MFTLPRGPWIEQRTHRLWNFRTDFCLFWQLNTFHHPEQYTQALSKGSKMNCNENNLLPLETDAGQCADSASKIRSQMYYFFFMNGGIKFVSQHQHRHRYYNFVCFACLSSLCIILRYFLIYKLISTLQRPVRIYYLYKTGIPWTPNRFLNRAHDKQQLAPKFLFKTGCCQILTLIAPRSPMLQHTKQYLHCLSYVLLLLEH